MKLAELMKQDTITLTAGDFLVANTEAVGYLPTYKDTHGLHSGQYLFKIKAGAVEGAFTIVPMVMAEDQKSYVEDTKNPIVMIEAGKITFVTTRNDPDYRDVYRSADAKVVEGIPTGEEVRHGLAAFIAFADSEYSLGVQHFQVAGADYLEA